MAPIYAFPTGEILINNRDPEKETTDAVTTMVDDALTDVAILVRRLDALRQTSLSPEQEVLLREALDGTANLTERVRALTFHDPLTGALNIYGFRQFGDQGLALAERDKTSYTIGLVDVDHFKELNAREGHNAADAVLRAIVDHLHTSLRKSDVIARRTYGSSSDEFLLGLPETNGHEFRSHLEQILQGIPSYLRGLHLPITTVSAGLATYRLDGDTLHALEDRADAYHLFAKEHGRNQVYAGDGSVVAMPVQRFG